MKNRLGVCSWSLRPGSPEELVERVRMLGLDGVQLALDPLRREKWSTERTVLLLREAGIAVHSGMMATVGEDYSSLDAIRRTGGLVPDAHWEENLAVAEADAELAGRLGLELVSFHAGFVPEEPGPARERLLERLRHVADRFARHGVLTALETGQESAANLTAFLAELDHPRVGVNFDPANMLLYGMGDPIRALRDLTPSVRQIHVKDACRTSSPGTWGTEVAVGKGEVDWDAFFDVIAERELAADLMIEREAGEDRTEDIRTAAEFVRAKLTERGVQI